MSSKFRYEKIKREDVPSHFMANLHETGSRIFSKVLNKVFSRRREESTRENRERIPPIREIRLLSYNVNNRPNEVSKRNIKSYIKEKIDLGYDIIALQESDWFRNKYQNYHRQKNDLIGDPNYPYQNTTYINTKKWRILDIRVYQTATTRPLVCTLISPLVNPTRTFLVINLHFCHFRGYPYDNECDPPYTDKYISDKLNLIFSEMPSEHVIMLGDTNEYLNGKNNPYNLRLRGKNIIFVKPDKPTCCSKNLQYSPDIAAIDSVLNRQYNISVVNPDYDNKGRQITSSRHIDSDHKPIDVMLRLK